MTTIYVTEALTGAKRKIKYEDICDYQMESAEAEDYGFNKVPSDDHGFWDNCFNKTYNGDMTRISLSGWPETINILHSMDEIESGMDHGVRDFHMNSRLRARMLAELDRLRPEIEAAPLNGMMHINEKFGAPAVVPFSGCDDDMMEEDITTVPRGFIEVHANIRAGLRIDSSTPAAEPLRILQRNDQAAFVFEKPTTAG